MANSDQSLSTCVVLICRGSLQTLLELSSSRPHIETLIICALDLEDEFPVCVQRYGDNLLELEDRHEAAYKALQYDNVHLQKSGEEVEFLVEALRNISTTCRNIVIAQRNWVYNFGPTTTTDRYPILGKQQIMSDLGGVFPLGQSSHGWARACRLVWTAVSRSGASIDSFEVRGGWGENRTITESDFTIPSLPASSAVSRLTKLSVDVRAQGLRKHSAFHTFLGFARNVKDLHINFLDSPEEAILWQYDGGYPTFPHLEKIMLRNVRFTSRSILTFLRENSNMNTLRLHEVSLSDGNWRDIFQFISGMRLDDLEIGNLCEGKVPICFQIFDLCDCETLMLPPSWPVLTAADRRRYLFNTSISGHGKDLTKILRQAEEYTLAEGFEGSPAIIRASKECKLIEVEGGYMVQAD